MCGWDCETGGERRASGGGEEAPIIHLYKLTNNFKISISTLGISFQKAVTEGQELSTDDNKRLF